MQRRIVHLAWRLDPKGHSTFPMMFVGASIVSSTVARQAVQTTLRSSLHVQTHLRQLGELASLTPNPRKVLTRMPVLPPRRVFRFPKERRKRWLRWAIAFSTVR